MMRFESASGKNESAEVARESKQCNNEVKPTKRIGMVQVLLFVLHLRTNTVAAILRACKKRVDSDLHGSIKAEKRMAATSSLHRGREMRRLMPVACLLPPTSSWPISR